MQDVAPINDLEVIDQFLTRCGAPAVDGQGKPLSHHARSTIAAKHLSRYTDRTVTPQQLTQWVQRRAVAAHKRLAFLQAYNDLPGRKLPLTWLATPLQRHNGGRANGGKNKRTAQASPRPKGKGGKRSRTQQRNDGASAA